MRSALVLVCVLACGPSEAPVVDTQAALTPDAEQDPPAMIDEPDFTSLFDGVSLAGWRMAGSGRFVAVDGNLSSLPGCDGLGLLWSTVPTPPNYELRLEWRRSAESDNSGVFVRFPHPDSKGYDNTAWVGVHFGLEVQIDDSGAPDGAAVHRTGAIYEQPAQELALVASRPVGEWNDYAIRVEGQRYTVTLNGVQVSQLTFTGDPDHPGRGEPSTPAEPRYVGLQSHTGLVSFRNLRIRAL